MKDSGKNRFSSHSNWGGTTYVDVCDVSYHYRDLMVLGHPSPLVCPFCVDNSRRWTSGSPFTPKV